MKGNSASGGGEPRRGKTANRTRYRVLSVVELTAIVIATFVVIMPIQDYALKEFKEWPRHPLPETLTAFRNKQQEESHFRTTIAGPFVTLAALLGLPSVAIASEVKELARPSTIAKSSPLIYAFSMSIFPQKSAPQKSAQFCICCMCCMRVSAGAGRLSF